MHRKGMHACTQGIVHGCMHAHTLAHLPVHTQDTCTFAHKHHACMHTSPHACRCAHTEHRHTCTQGTLQVCVHTHTQVLVGLCLYSNPRRAAELRVRRGKAGGKEGKSRAGRGSELMVSWSVGYLGEPSPGSCRAATAQASLPTPLTAPTQGL